MKYFLKIEKLGTGEMTQLVKCLPYKQEGLVGFPELMWKSLA